MSSPGRGQEPKTDEHELLTPKYACLTAIWDDWPNERKGHRVALEDNRPRYWARAHHTQTIGYSDGPGGNDDDE